MGNNNTQRERQREGNDKGVELEELERNNKIPPCLGAMNNKQQSGGASSPSRIVALGGNIEVECV